MSNFLKSNWQLLLILLLGILLRLYRFDQFFMYSHDSDLAGWFVKDVVVDKHIRLIGQETSTRGIFIGGFFYYLQIPFYLLTGMDPIGVTFLGIVLGALYILGIYHILSKSFSKNIALIGAAFYAFSFIFVFNDREIVPTQPVIFWSFAFFWGLSEIIKGNLKKGLTIIAFLVPLIWHLNFALILPLVIIPIALFLSGKRIKPDHVFIPIVIIILLSLPLLLFEYRHDFIQTKALISSLTTDQNDIISGGDKVVRVYHLVSKNYYSIVLPSLSFPKYEHVMLFFVILFVFLYKNLVKLRKVFTLLFIWFLVYFLFFSFYSKIMSEYYLSGLQFIPVILLSILFNRMLSEGRYKVLGFVILFILFLLNLYRIFTIPVNRSGYLERKAIVSWIKKDAVEKGFPCVSVSYITDPGYNLGYRYFFRMSNLKVVKPSLKTPVYTIVFPLKEKVFITDKTFGALGLIYPDYSRYTKEGIREGCSGEDENLTDPMFGFTK